MVVVTKMTRAKKLNLNKKDLDDDIEINVTNVCVKSSSSTRTTNTKILPHTTSIGNEKAAADHIELTDGVGQHLVDELITQFKVNRYSVEMNKIKLSQKDSLKKVHGRVVE